MNILKKSTIFAMTIPMLAAISPAIAQADGLDGNRYDLEKRYDSEVSAARAYLESIVQDTDTVIIDVRTIEEHMGGHPEGSYNVPYPHIYNRQRSDAKPYAYIPQNDADFIYYVNALGLAKDTPIITMCRTGYRSVGAGNLLADEGYTNVRNMWQGFKGNLKYNETSEVAAKLDDTKKKPKALIDNGEKVLIPVLGQALDLDGDGDVDKSDVFSGDLDGWANYQGLPVDFELEEGSLYQGDESYLYTDPAVVGER
ncbi:MAG: rhodanese-like domain-containing protein [Gammaproteobacteria bacterium]|nr:rhodanese-like domain-containing protein [Gammaproteobacteria bacterium]